MPKGRVLIPLDPFSRRSPPDDVRIDWRDPDERVDGALTTASVLRWSAAGLDQCHDEFAAPRRTAVAPFEP